MPRRSAQKAESEIKREMEIRWAYLLRNPHFQKAMDELMDIRTGKKKDLEGREFTILKKYRVNNLSDDHLKLLISSSLTWDTGKREELVVKKPPLEGPVVALYWPDESDHMASGMGTGPYMTITVDLSYPIDLLLPLIEEEIRTAHPFLGRRRHRDKDAFKLKVYDLAQKRVPFTLIAMKLKSRVSTVKSAYIAARRNIFENIAGKLHDCEKCPTCKKAKTIDQLCPQARADIHSRTTDDV